jgi:hypothetical protein
MLFDEPNKILRVHDFFIDISVTVTIPITMTNASAH